MNQKEFFKGINFNKSWDEHDWEKFFVAHDEYRLAIRSQEIRKKPISRIKFEGNDEVEAFQEVLHQYGTASLPLVLPTIHTQKFPGDQDPENSNEPAAEDDPHFWIEGAPLSKLLIYRDACRFAIYCAKELSRLAKRRGEAYRKKTGTQIELIRFHANWLAINIADGHRLGYSEDRLYGNIAKCLRAIKHADACIGLLSQISKTTRSQIIRTGLFSYAFQLRMALYQWVDELRSHIDE